MKTKEIVTLVVPRSEWLVVMLVAVLFSGICCGRAFAQVGKKDDFAMKLANRLFAVEIEQAQKKYSDVAKVAFDEHIERLTRMQDMEVKKNNLDAAIMWKTEIEFWKKEGPPGLNKLLASPQIMERLFAPAVGKWELKWSYGATRWFEVQSNGVLVEGTTVYKPELRPDGVYYVLNDKITWKIWHSGSRLYLDDQQNYAVGVRTK